MEILLERTDSADQAKELINSLDGKSNKTPLHYALELDHRGMAEFLIKHGAGNTFFVSSSRNELISLSPISRRRQCPGTPADPTAHCH